MAHIRGVPPLNPTRFEVRYDVRDEYGRRRQRTKTFRRKGDAEKFRRRVEHEADLGTLRDPMLGRVTFGALVERWQQSQAWAGLKPSTAARYETVLRVHVLPRWEDVQLSRITRADADAWVVELSRGRRSPATVGKVYGVWRQALNHAVYLGWLPVNPAAGVPMPRVREREQLYLSPEEVWTLAGAVPPRYRAMILTAAFAGLRFGELAGLRRRNVNLLAGRLTVAESLSQVDGRAAEWTTPKNGKARTVDLPASLREELARHWERYTEGGTGPEGVVFTGGRGALLDRHNFTRRDFRPAVKRALPAEKHRLRFHDLRHTCAAILIELGTHPKLIADTLGHSSIQITMDRYGHLLERPRAEMLARLDARMVEVERRCGAEAAAPAN